MVAIAVSALAADAWGQVPAGDPASVAHRASPMTGMETPPVHFDVGIATEFPVMLLGATALLEVPYGLQLRADVGWLGSPYTDAINGFLNAVGAYGTGQTADATSQLVLAALHDSLVFRAGAGWRPFAAHGFEVFGGYTLITLGGSLGAKEAITAVTGKPFANSDTSADVTIQSTLHNVSVGVGWRWLFLGDHLVLRASGEYLQTLASSTSLALQSGQGGKDLANVSAPLSAYLDGVYTTYVKTPVVSVGLAYRF